MKKERQQVKLSDLVLNTGQIEWLPRNPRQWGKDELDSLIRSLEEDPDYMEDRPPLVTPCEGKYLVFAGNMRTTAEQKRKVRKSLECVVYVPENETDKQTIVRRAAKDNGSWGKWDYDILANEWDDLQLADWGIPAWDAEAQESQPEPEAKEDDFDETKDSIEVRCKPGDIWQLGEHRLMCGDSIDLEQVKRLMGGVEADLLLTDPPYNVAYEGKTQDHLKIQNDQMGNSQFKEFLTGAFGTANEVMRPGAAYYIWHADSEGYNFRTACSEVGWKVRQCLVWCKNSMVIGRHDYQWKHEPCLYGWKDGAAHYFIDSRRESTVIPDAKELDFKKMKKEEAIKLLQDIYGAQMATSVIDCEKPTANTDHPTMKPVKLIAYQMANSSHRGDYVLDLFGGSGTTLMAAEQLGRKARLMELDPHYCDVIIARWEKLTGKEAVRL